MAAVDVCMSPQSLSLTSRFKGKARRAGDSFKGFCYKEKERNGVGDDASKGAFLKLEEFTAVL